MHPIYPPFSSSEPDFTNSLGSSSTPSPVHASTHHNLLSPFTPLQRSSPGSPMICLFSACFLSCLSVWWPCSPRHDLYPRFCDTALPRLPPPSLLTPPRSGPGSCEAACFLAALCSEASPEAAHPSLHLHLCPFICSPVWYRCHLCADDIQSCIFGPEFSPECPDHSISQLESQPTISTALIPSQLFFS